MLAPHPFEQVYIAGVGLGHEPVDDDWSAFDHEYLYFSTVPKQVVKGAHVFALGAGRRSAVLGLFEVVKAGASLSPKNPWNPDRWPYNLQIQPLASVPPPEATNIDGVRAPRGNAVHIRDEEKRMALYRAMS
jgi:hypothetical protein